MIAARLLIMVVIMLIWRKIIRNLVLCYVVYFNLLCLNELWYSLVGTFAAGLFELLLFDVMTLCCILVELLFFFSRTNLFLWRMVV